MSFPPLLSVRPLFNGCCSSIIQAPCSRVWVCHSFFLRNGSTNGTLSPTATESKPSVLPNCFVHLIHRRIIPQAISVRYGLFVGATCAPLVLAMMYIFGTFFFFFCIRLVLIAFLSTHCLPNCKDPGLPFGNRQPPYVQKGRTQVLPAVSSNWGRTPPR